MNNVYAYLNDKYQMFSNYMHNELGITKEDIRAWIEDAVDEQAKRLVNNEFNDFDARSVVKKLVYDEDIFGRKEINNKIINEVAKQLIERIEINLK
jgi:hypothetical protein